MKESENAKPCSRQGKMIGGCKFEPRYDIIEPTKELRQKISMQWSISEQDKEFLVRRTEYICDVCIRCGKVVNLQQD